MVSETTELLPLFLWLGELLSRINISASEAYNLGMIFIISINRIS